MSQARWLRSGIVVGRCDHDRVRPPSALPTRRPERLTRSQARRIAVAAQGLAGPRPIGQITARHLQRVLDTVAVLQIDSVNVVSRSHYLPLFSRMTP